MKKDKGVCITIGYIFIETKPEKEHEVYNSLSTEKRVIELNPIFQDTDFDLVAKVKSRNHKRVKSFVTKKIHSLDGVVNTEIFC